MDIAFYKRLARDGIKSAARIVKALDGSPDQPRDPDGKWGSGGGEHAAGNNEKAATSTNKMTERYKELQSAHNKAAHAYHNAATSRPSAEQERAEAAAGLEFKTTQRARKSFEERHPEMVEKE